LGGDLDTVLAEKLGLFGRWMHGHGYITGQILILSNVVLGPCYRRRAGAVVGRLAYQPVTMGKVEVVIDQGD